MHTRELIDLAAFVAAQGPILVHSTRQVSTSALAQYWTASKCRLDRWSRSLGCLHRQPPQELADSEAAQRTARSVCEEIIVSEMLTRVWSSILHWFDSTANKNEAQHVATSVLAGQLEASNRALVMMASRHVFSPPTNVELNRLRRMAERWTDFLLGGFGPQGNPLRFAHDAGRAEEFTQDFARHRNSTIRMQIWGIVNSSLRAAFGPQLQGDAANADLNSRIAGAILGCFPAEAFDSAGTYRSLWLLRLSATASDTQMLVESLLSADGSNKAPGAVRAKATALIAPIQWTASTSDWLYNRASLRSRFSSTSALCRCSNSQNLCQPSHELTSRWEFYLSSWHAWPRSMAAIA